MKGNLMLNRTLALMEDWPLLSSIVVFLAIGVLVTLFFEIVVIPNSVWWYVYHDAQRIEQLVLCKANPVELSVTKNCINAVSANKVRLKQIADVEFTRIPEQPARSKP
jgi:hypothetical protein